MASSILETCWLAECVPVSLSDYREKLQLLQKLDCSNYTYRNAVTNNFINGKLPLSYLFGVLFLNFKLLWDPISKIISSYGSALAPKDFWDVFGKQMEAVVLVIRGAPEPTTDSLDFHCKPTSLSFFFEKVERGCWKRIYLLRLHLT